MSHSVTYNGNTSDGGTPPTDPKSPYNAGDTVTVQPVGSLSKTGAVFAYWNTEADGSGTFYGWPTATTFPMPAADVVLYAQWFVTTGLMNGGPLRTILSLTIVRCRPADWNRHAPRRL
jgi:hypothetical protein